MLSRISPICVQNILICLPPNRISVSNISRAQCMVLVCCPGADVLEVLGPHLLPSTRCDSPSFQFASRTDSSDPLAQTTWCCVFGFLPFLVVRSREEFSDSGFCITLGSNYPTCSHVERLRSKISSLVIGVRRASRTHSLRSGARGVVPLLLGRDGRGHTPCD